MNKNIFQDSECEQLRLISKSTKAGTKTEAKTAELGTLRKERKERKKQQRIDKQAARGGANNGAAGGGNNVGDKNILLYTCPLDIHSGGLTNLFLFFNLCRKKGYNIFLCPLLKDIDTLNFFSPFNNKNLEEITQEELEGYFKSENRHLVINVELLRSRDNIVIYTEDVIGNPAEQKYVVRWLHFFPNPKAVNNYSFENDYICFFSNYIFNLYDNLCKNLNIYNYMQNKIKTPNILRVFHFNKDIYKDNKHSREGGCFVHRKGYPPAPFFYAEEPKKLAAYLSTMELVIKKNKELGYQYIDHGITHSDMIELFNDKEFLISLDPFTFTSIIAALCGCNSIVVKIPNLSYEDWKNSDPFNKYGIAYGYENIKEAKKTRHLLEEHIYNMYLENETNIDNFILSITNFFKLK